MKRNETKQHYWLRFWEKFNPIDLGIVVLLAVAVGRLFTVYLPPPRTAQTVEVTLELLVRNVPAYVSQSIAVGQDLFQDRSESYVGKICSRYTQPAELLVSKQGRLVSATAPCNLDLYLKLCRSGRVVTGSAPSGIYLGKLAVRIGEQIETHTLYTALTGEITTLKLRRLPEKY